MLGKELIINGNFGTGDFTGWDEHTTPGTSIVGNACQFDHTGGNVFLGQDFTNVLGKKYRLSYEITANTGVGSGEFILSVSGLLGSNVLDVFVGTHSYVFEAVNSSPIKDLRFLFYVTEPGDTIIIDNISVREDIPIGLSRTGYRFSSFPEN